MGVSLKVKLMKTPSLEPKPDGDPFLELTFVNYPDEGNFFKNYYLFSWLGSVRSGLKPRDDVAFWKKQTNDFFDRVGRLYKDKNPGPLCDSQAFLEKIDMDQMDLVIYPVDLLLAFDYDQVQILDIEDGVKDLEGHTYRDQFSQDLLPVLAYAKQHDLPYVLFGFES